MKNMKSIILIISVISILALTFNVVLVQAAPPSITMTLTGEGNVQVTAYTDKDKEITLGTFDAPNNFKLTGNLAKVVFVITPDPQYHVKSINQNGELILYGDPNLVDLEYGVFNYTLYVVEKQNTIDVIFSNENSEIIGSGESANLGLTSQLTVNTDSPIKFVGVELQDRDYSAWDITAVEYEGEINVTVALYFTSETDPRGENGVRLYRTDLEYPNADVTGDNQITSDDVNAVSAINPGTGPEDPTWNATLDINGDSVINGEDVNIVAGYNPIRNPPGVWEDITAGWINLQGDQWLVYGYTDHFSLFRCR